MERPIFGYLIAPSSAKQYTLLLRGVDAVRGDGHLVWCRSGCYEILGQVRELRLENRYAGEGISEAALASQFGGEFAGSLAATDRQYVAVVPLAVRDVRTGELVGDWVLPPSGTPFYEVEAEQAGTYYQRSSLFMAGWVMGTRVPLGIDIRDFGESGWGDARLVGVAGRSGSGKSVLAATLAGAYAGQRDLGILLIDPQGQFSSSDEFGRYAGEMGKAPQKWSWRLSRMFELANRMSDVVVAGWDEVRLDEADTDTFLELLDYYKFWPTLRPGVRGDKVEVAVARLRGEPLASCEWAEIEGRVVEALARAYSPSRQERALEEIRELGDIAGAGAIWEKVRRYFSPVRRYGLSDLLDGFLLRHKIVILRNDSADLELQLIFCKALFKALRSRAQGLYWASQRSGRRSQVNGLVVLDECQRLIPEYPDGDRQKELVKLVEDVVHTGRKLGVGWLFATQSVANISKAVWRQLGTVFIGYGFGVGADKARLLEIVDSEVYERYQGLPPPLQSGRYWFLVQGELVALGGGRPFFVECFPEQETLIRANRNYYGTE